MKCTQTKDVQTFFERAATDRDTMRLSNYDGCVIERMAAACPRNFTILRYSSYVK